MLLATLFFSMAIAEACTEEEAQQKPGHWSAASDDLAMADSTYAKSKYAALFKKTDHTIALLKKAIGEAPGIEARAYRSVRGSPYVKDGPVPFGINSLYLGYYCVPDTPSYPKIRGTIQPGGETGTWIDISFNTLGWLASDNVSLGKALTTSNGAWIYYRPKTRGELKGHPIWLPEVHREKSEAIVLVPEGRSPFKALSRESFLRARERSVDKKLEDLAATARKMIEDREKTLATMAKLPVTEEQRTKTIAAFEKTLEASQAGIERTKAQLEADKQALAAYREGLSAEERAAPTVVRDPYAMPASGKLFVSEGEGGRALVTIDGAVFKAEGARDVIRAIVVYLRWEDQHPAKRAVIERFKEKFDLAALEAMLGH